MSKIEKIKSLVEQNYTATEISRKTHLSQSKLRTIMKKNDIAIRRKNELIKDRVVESKSVIDIRELANEFRCSPALVISVMKQNKVKIPERATGLLKKDKSYTTVFKIVAELLKTNDDMVSIATRLGVSRQFVYKTYSNARKARIPFPNRESGAEK